MCVCVCVWRFTQTQTQTQTHTHETRRRSDEEPLLVDVEGTEQRAQAAKGQDKLRQTADFRSNLATITWQSALRLGPFFASTFLRWLARPTVVDERARHGLGWRLFLGPKSQCLTIKSSSINGPTDVGPDWNWSCCWSAASQAERDFYE